MGELRLVSGDVFKLKEGESGDGFDVRFEGEAGVQGDVKVADLSRCADGAPIY